MKKKNYLMMAFVGLLAAAAFCACSKDDEGNDGNLVGTWQVVSFVSISSGETRENADIITFKKDGNGTWEGKDKDGNDSWVDPFTWEYKAPVLIINWGEDKDDATVTELTAKYLILEYEGAKITCERIG